MVAGMPLPGYEVDHINRNGLDNRRENLRVVPKGINRANAVIYKNNKTGYRGVRLSACGKKFLACITTNGKSQHLGTFDTAEAASRAYLQKKGKR